MTDVIRTCGSCGNGGIVKTLGSKMPIVWYRVRKVVKKLDSNPCSKWRKKYD